MPRALTLLLVLSAFAELGSPMLPAQGASDQFEFELNALVDIGGNCKIYTPE